MKSRYLPNVGTWLFILALAWYLVGNFSLLAMQKERLALAQSVHQTNQAFDVGGSGTLVIRKLDTSGYGERVNIIFDPTLSQATVHNENLQLSVTGHAVNGAFHIAIVKDKLMEEHWRQKEIDIHLPPLVKKMTFFGVSDVFLSGSLPTSAEGLTLELSGCGQQISMNDLTVSQLKLTATCQLPPTQTCCTSNFSLNNNVKVDKLEVMMQQGNLDLSGNLIPQQTILKISDQVRVTARRGFFQTARFSDYAP